jgi:hypothetical protein
VATWWPTCIGLDFKAFIFSVTDACKARMATDGWGGGQGSSGRFSAWPTGQPKRFGAGFDLVSSAASICAFANRHFSPALDSLAAIL